MTGYYECDYECVDCGKKFPEEQVVRTRREGEGMVFTCAGCWTRNKPLDAGKNSQATTGLEKYCPCCKEMTVISTVPFRCSNDGCLSRFVDISLPCPTCNTGRIYPVFTSLPNQWKFKAWKGLQDGVTELDVLSDDTYWEKALFVSGFRCSTAGCTVQADVDRLIRVEKDLEVLHGEFDKDRVDTLRALDEKNGKKIHELAIDMDEREARENKYDNYMREAFNGDAVKMAKLMKWLLYWERNYQYTGEGSSVRSVSYLLGRIRRLYKIRDFESSFYGFIIGMHCVELEREEESLRATLTRAKLRELTGGNTRFAAITSFFTEASILDGPEKELTDNNNGHLGTITFLRAVAAIKLLTKHLVSGTVKNSSDVYSIWLLEEQVRRDALVLLGLIAACNESEPVYGNLIVRELVETVTAVFERDDSPVPHYIYNCFRALCTVYLGDKRNGHEYHYTSRVDRTLLAPLEPLLLALPSGTVEVNDLNKYCLIETAPLLLGVLDTSTPVRRLHYNEPIFSRAMEMDDDNRYFKYEPLAKSSGLLDAGKSDWYSVH
ncbi:MAG: hypothetical protein ACFFD4_25665 [Candidatus Odinarchaeota archaeon]